MAAQSGKSVLYFTDKRYPIYCKTLKFKLGYPHEPDLEPCDVIAIENFIYYHPDPSYREIYKYCLTRHPSGWNAEVWTD